MTPPSTPRRPRRRATPPSTTTARMAIIPIGGCTCGATPSPMGWVQTGQTRDRYDGIDDFGAFWNVPLKDPSQALNFIIHRGDEKDPGPDQSFIPQDDASVWIMSMDETIYAQRGAAQDFATLHYRRPAGDYGDYTSTNYADFWGLHTWDGADDPGWTTPRKPVRQDTFGQVFEVPLHDAAATQIGYIFHRGDEKDPGADQFLDFAKYGYEVWQLQGADVDNPYILPILITGGPNPGNIGEQRAYWVSEDTIAWDSGAASPPTPTGCTTPRMAACRLRMRASPAAAT